MTDAQQALALIAGLLGCGSADGDPAQVEQKPAHEAQVAPKEK